jgi:signal transduction histidine kinase
MMEQMGGRIGLEPPQPGQGAVFWIALPPAPQVEQPLG